MGKESQNTQTQTQNSQIEWSQSQPNSPAFIPTIWGRLYYYNHNSGKGKCWKIPANQQPNYHDLIQPEFSLGRAITCSFVIKREIVKEEIIKSVSKQHFILRRDLSEPLCPAIITDLSHNGTFVNGEKVGKNKSRVLDDNDEISITHPIVKIFVFKDLLKNEQDNLPKEISNKYYVSRTLGQGACGLVKLVFDKTKCTRHAMKIIKKSVLTNGQANNLNNPKKIMNEIKIMKALRHPCIISVEEVFDSRETVFIILELMPGGELFDRITKHGHLSEHLTRFLFRQMVLAVKYLHSQGITHRDLKPENVLLEGKEDETLVKITDFGLSKLVGEDSFMKTMCGTANYVAPEVLGANGVKTYGPEVDVWSLGVIFFVCLVGYLPFSLDYKDMSLKHQIQHGRYRFSHEHWKGISLQAKLLMKRMLTVQVNRRITLDQILNHPWMQDTNVIVRVEKMMSQAMQVKSFSKLTMSSSSDEENQAEDVAIIRIVAAGKRALSNSYSSIEPIPKKLRMAVYPSIEKSDDTSSTTSMNDD